MSDFHRSLDRALEHDPHTDWGFGAREVMAAELGIHSAYPHPPVDRSFVDAFEPPQPVIDVQRQINKMIERMLATQEIPTEGQE